MAKIFINGEILEGADAKVSASDSSFLYGIGLFETMRADGGEVFGLDDHLDRLFASAEKLHIKSDYDREYVTDAIYKTLKANSLTDARLRLTLTNGPAGDEGKSTLLISATEFTPYPPEFYEKGVTVILSDIKQNPTDPNCGHKTTSYSARMAALGTAHQKRATEAIWFTTDNRLAEGCVSNVFLVKGSVVLTPPVETPVLGGVMRKTICEIAKQKGIEVVEKDLFIADLLGADEVFLTNVVMGALPVVAVEAHTVGDGKVGTVTKKLIAALEKIL